MILYEYPFNERIRTYLRLEHLFDRLGQLIARQDAVDHHFALTTLFEIIEVASRSELKPDVLQTPYIVAVLRMRQIVPPIAQPIEQINRGQVCTVSVLALHGP